MQRSIFNSEFSDLLKESTHYLEFVDRGVIEERIENGLPLRLNKMSSYDFDRNYENKFLNIALSALHYLGIANKYVSYVVLILSVIQIQNFVLLNIFSVTGFGVAVFVLYFVSELGRYLELYICNHIYEKSSLRHMVKAYNRDIDHINKCFRYISEDSDNKQINDILSRYTSRFAGIFRSTGIPNVSCFVEAIEQQVEEALAVDLSNGGLDTIQSDLSLLSIFPERIASNNKEALLLMSLNKAEFLLDRVTQYCSKEIKQTAIEQKGSISFLTDWLCQIALISIVLGVSSATSSFFHVIVTGILATCFAKGRIVELQGYCSGGWQVLLLQCFSMTLLFTGLLIGSEITTVAGSLFVTIFNIFYHTTKLSHNVYKDALTLEEILSDHLPCGKDLFEHGVERGNYYLHLLSARSRLYKHLDVEIPEEDVALGSLVVG